mgnify:CR=1 FL=1
MKAIVRILYCCAVFSIIACGGDNSFNVQLRHLDSLLIEHPDSVYQVLEGMENDVHVQPESARMYYELLRADAQNKAYIDFTTDSVMLQVADYYDQHGTANEKMRAHYLLGCTYRDLNDVPMELQCFQEATEKADTTQKDCDLYTLVAIYGQMADLYYSQYLPEEELTTLKKCEEVAWKDKDTLSALKAYELRIRPYSSEDKLDSVLLITKNARKNYLKFNKVKEAAILLGPCISILLDRKEFDSARTYMDIFERESGLWNEGNIISTNAKLYYYFKGKLSLIDDKTDSARYYFYELQKAGWKEAAYEGFVQLYKKTGNTDSLAKYAELYVKANDSARVSTNAEVIEQMSAMYDYTLREQKNKELSKSIEQEKFANKTMLFYVVLVTLILIIIILLFVYAYKEHYRKNKQKLADTITRYNSAVHLLEENEEQKRMLEEKLLSSKGLAEDIVGNYQKEIETLNERIQESNTLIANLRSRYSDVDFNAWIDNFVKAEVVFKLQDLLTPHSAGHVYTADDKLWKQIYKHFKENAYSFATHIRNERYGLNEIDIKVVMLTVLGFKTNDVALLLDKSSNHITNIRKRIADKLFNKEISARRLREELLYILKTMLEVTKA